MTKNSRRNKNRSARKQARHLKNKKQLASLERLEPKQMLTADSLDFKITLVDSNGPTTYQADTSHSYAAPWTWKLPNGQQIQGAGESKSWTAEQSGHQGQLTHTTDHVIKTIHDYKKHLIAGTVAEVSDDLVACFYYTSPTTPAVDSLYSPLMENAWVGSSDNLYSLLVLNKRFPKDSHDTTLALRRGGNGNLTGRAPGRIHDSSLAARELIAIVSDKAMQAMTRIVGFPFGGVAGGVAPDPVSADGTPALAVFNRTHGSFSDATDPDQTVSSLSDFVPTLSQFYKFTNDSRPDGSSPLPLSVLRHLQNWYSDGFLDEKTPIDLFSEMSGIGNLEALLEYSTFPQYLAPGAVAPNLPNPHHLPVDQLNQPPVYDAYYNPPAPSDRISPNYEIYHDACAAVGGYYLTSYISNEDAIDRFFTGFANTKLTELSAIDQSLDPTAYESKVNELAVGLRALMAMSYDAAPLWTSYGVGFSNAANPLVGKSYEALRQSENFLQIFAGQEFQLLNINLPPTFLNVTGQHAAPSQPYPSDGWYSLHADVPLSGLNIMTDVSDNDYQDQYSISTPGAAVILPEDSTSSDTLSAAGLVAATPAELLTPQTSVIIDTATTTLGERPGLINDEQVLPDSFATYIALAGGIDLVTGSALDDVIIGPGHGAETDTTFHGRLTVSAGPGDDVVAPGRGGSVIELGSGADLVVFDTNDLFGEATFFDFNYTEGDRIIVSDQIESEWDFATPDTLILRDQRGASKTLRLAAASDEVWHRDVVIRVRPTELALGASIAVGGSAGSATGPNGEFNYLETHQFVFAGAQTEYFHKSLVIEAAPGRPALPEEIWVTAGNIPYQSKSTTGKHTIPLNSTGLKLDSSPWVDDTGHQPVVISITPYDDAGVYGFGSRQAQVFITPDDGYMRDKYDSTTDFKVNLTLDDMTGQLGSDPDELAQTGWRLFKEANKTTYAVAYVGGLANIILNNDLNATSTLPNALEPVQLKINRKGISKGEFRAGVGNKAFNLSSGMAIWGGLTKQVADTVMAQTLTAAQGAYVFDLPTGLSPKDYVLKTLATDQPIVVSGTGRINGFDIVSTYTNKTDAKKHATYWVNSDLLTVSSVHQTNNADSNDWAVDVSAITVAWPAYRGYGPVLLQDYDNGVAIVQKDSSGEFEIDVDPTDNRLKFQNSKVRMRGYRQAGGWVDQADGPAIAGWYSEMTNSFIHANDDSVKLQAGHVTASANTVLQGNAGNAVGYAYGFVNGADKNTLTDGVFVHRIVNKQKGNGYGVVAMRVVPAKPTYNWTPLAQFTFNQVKNLYVPAFDKVGFGSMNSVYRANVLEIGNECRGFGPTIKAGDPSFVFEVGAIDTTSGWEILADHRLASEASVVRWSDAANPNKPKKDANGHWTFEPNKFSLYETLPDGTRKLTSTIATVQQNTSWGPINLYQTPKSTTDTKTIRRPKLHRSSKIHLNRDGAIGPNPIRLVHSDLVQAASYGTTAGEESFVVSGVANGSVEKKIGNFWFNVSEAPKSSNPFELLALLQRRLISPTDEIRWVPAAEDSSKATAEAFSIFGWNGKDKLSSDKASVISFEAD